MKLKRHLGKTREMKNEPGGSKKREGDEGEDHLYWRNRGRYHRRKGICSIYSMTLLCDFPAYTDFPIVKTLTLGVGLLKTYC